MGNCSSSSGVQQTPTIKTSTQNSVANNRDKISNQRYNETSNENNILSDQNRSNIQTKSSLEEAKREFTMRYTEPVVKKSKIEDFQLQRTIGTGSFAHVMLAKHENQLLALKIMEKQSIVELNCVKQILSEKRILQAINCPFVVSLKYAFKDHVHLYLALELATGGDMFSDLR